MALLESIDVPLGSLLPEFNLPDPSGKKYSSQKLLGENGLLVVFTCNHCPYALAIWPRLISLAKKSLELGIPTVGINPNIHPDYPEDSPHKMTEKIQKWNIPFPYLVDESQKTAKTYRAQCTPDIYLFDQNKKLVYHGRLDDNWQEPNKVTKQELLEAIQNLAEGQPISDQQKPTVGCSIKWR